jgi:hypothetical protein
LKTGKSSRGMTVEATGIMTALATWLSSSTWYRVGRAATELESNQMNS